MRRSATLLAVAMICLVHPVTEARARSAAVTPTVPPGRMVMIEIIGGARFKGRVVQISATGVDLRREDGTTVMIPWEHIVRVALGRLPGTRRSWPAKVRKEKPPTPRLGAAWQPRNFYVEGIGLRVAAGDLLIPDADGYWDTLGLGGFEVTLATLHWRYFYWEIFRGVVSWPILGVGTALGVPIRLDNAGWHQLRVGAHLTANLILLGVGLEYILGPSGLQIYYQYRLYRHFAIHVGLQQYSYPFALALIFGFST